MMVLAFNCPTPATANIRVFTLLTKQWPQHEGAYDRDGGGWFGLGCADYWSIGIETHFHQRAV